MSVNVISVERVSLRLGARPVLSDASFSVAAGEFIGVLGPNGAGKTTLMRALLGLVPVSAGAMRVFGAPPRRGNAAIGVMPQGSSMPALRLSGFDYVAAAANGQAWGLPRLDAAGREDVNRALDLVQAGSLARRPLSSLSGGERQRLLLAQALLGQPKLLLLDEPLLSLDLRHQGGVVALVKRLQRDLGLTILFSAHDLTPLLGAAGRVLYLGGGHAAIGTVDEVITAPVLSRLYGAPVDVVRDGERRFVVAAADAGL